MKKDTLFLIGSLLIVLSPFLINAALLDAVIYISIGLFGIYAATRNKTKLTWIATILSVLWSCFITITMVNGIYKAVGQYGLYDNKAWAVGILVIGAILQATAIFLLPPDEVVKETVAN